MSYQNQKIADTAELLKQRFAELSDKTEILKAIELKALYDELKTLPAEQRAGFGKEINTLKAELQELLTTHHSPLTTLPPIDVTAPFDINTPAEKSPDYYQLNSAANIH